MQLIRPNSDNGRVSLALVVECKHFIICWALTFISSEAFENSFRKCEHTSTATLPVCLPFNALFLYAFKLLLSTSLILPLGLSTISIVASSGAQLWLAFQLNCTTYATRAEPTLPSVFALTPPPSLPPTSVWLLHLVQIIEIRPRDDVDSSIRCFDSSRRQRHFSKARQKETFAILSKKMWLHISTENTLACSISACECACASCVRVCVCGLTNPKTNSDNWKCNSTKITTNPPSPFLSHSQPKYGTLERGRYGLHARPEKWE